MSNAIVGTGARIHRNVGTAIAPVWEEVNPTAMQPFVPTSDEDALLAAIVAHPAEDTPRLMYADWLEENDCPIQAEWMRKGVAAPGDTVRLGPSDSVCFKGQVVATGFRQMRSNGSRPSGYVTYRRGLPEELDCHPVEWLRHGPVVRKREPVTRVVLSEPIIVEFTNQANGHRAPNCIYTVRISARGYHSGEPLPDECYLSSPATDVLCEDRYCGMITAADFERAVFDRLWPGVEILPVAVEPVVYEIASGPPAGVDGLGLYRRRRFSVFGDTDHLAAMRACRVPLRSPHPDDAQLVASDLNAVNESGTNHAWTVTVTYRPLERLRESGPGGRAADVSYEEFNRQLNREIGAVFGLRANIIDPPAEDSP